MSKELDIDHGHEFSLDGDDRQLSNRVVSWLSLPEQFVLWALRHRLANACPAPADPCLGRGFLLAFGLACCEAAARTFEDCFDLLQRFCRRDIVLCPPRCACISRDEERLFLLLCPSPEDVDAAAVRQGVARTLVQPQAVAALLAAAGRFRDQLAAADLDRLHRPDRALRRMHH